MSRAARWQQTYLFDLVVIACIGAWSIVCERFRSCEFVVAGGSGHDVAMAGDLPCESGDWACYLVDFREDDDAGEAGLRVVWDCGVVEEDTWRYLVSPLAQGRCRDRRMLPVSVETSWCDSVISMLRCGSDVMGESDFVG